MGISWSSTNRRRNNNNNNYYQNPHHNSLITSSSSSSSYSYPPDPYSPPLPHPYPPPPPPIYSPYYYSNAYTTCNYSNPMMGRPNCPNFTPYYPFPNNGWVGIRPAPFMAPAPAPAPAPPYVDQQQAKKVRNGVNVHKDTLKLEVDEMNPDHHLVSFVFDALLEGCFTIFYFAKEEPNCRLVPLFPEVYIPVKVPFQKGLGQRFRQPSRTGIDFSFFQSDDLSKPSSGDVFPLVICAETYLPYVPIEECLVDPLPSSSPNMQITEAVIEKNDENTLHVRVIRQILWIDGVRYELREIYGIGNSAAESFKDDDPGKACVICMTEPKDTAVLPCRHMCMCSECAQELRLQSNKCPICRQPIEELIEIKIDNVD